MNKEDKAVTAKGSISIPARPDEECPKCGLCNRVVPFAIIWRVADADGWHMKCEHCPHRWSA